MTGWGAEKETGIPAPLVWEYRVLTGGLRFRQIWTRSPRQVVPSKGSGGIRRGRAQGAGLAARMLSPPLPYFSPGSEHEVKQGGNGRVGRGLRIPSAARARLPGPAPPGLPCRGQDSPALPSSTQQYSSWMMEVGGNCASAPGLRHHGAGSALWLPGGRDGHPPLAHQTTLSPP